MSNNGLSLHIAFKYRRKHLGITQKELAWKLDVTEGQISYLESGTRQPKVVFLRKWADALKLELSITAKDRNYVEELTFWEQQSKEDRLTAIIDKALTKSIKKWFKK